MTKYPIIKNPEFIDLEKTRVKMILEDENGKQTVAEFKIPDGRQSGINEFWDRIVAEHDIEVMRRRRNNIEIARVREAERLEKKKRASVENELLRRLFDQKLYYFNLPFVNELTDEEKASIRRAPNETLLQIAASMVFISYMQRTGKSITTIFDEIEDKEFEDATSSTDKNV